MKSLFIYFIAITFCLQIQAQEKKQYTISRTDFAPTIDGVLDDKAWLNADIATDFIEFRPNIGATLPENKSTQVKMTYNDNAIFVSAYLKDDPKTMMRQFTQRDDFGQSDFFAVIFNTNNDAQNDTEFFVFSSGTQADAVASPSIGEDFGWNAVWESAVKIVDDGWILEMKIPYAALRFSNQENPVWGIQFHRQFKHNNSQFTWNALNPNKGNIGLYHGELNGLNNLKPPTRLSFYPFASSVIEDFDRTTEKSFNFGMDVKYGITENFTLDATLVPDFSQAGFDNVSLNLGPFEQRFSEQRQFFKEGVDLFSKGNLFYSRRIGNAPIGDVELSDNEIIEEFPEKVNMLNAVKISGRTKKGLGIGVLNAVTKKTYATLKDEDTGAIREEVVEPLANYNILVVDQQFNKNSSVSLINTNVTRNGEFRDANVTGLVLDLTNKENTYGLVAEAKMSNLNLPSGTETGFSSQIGFGKKSGKYRYSATYELADKKYDINDLGILFRNNYSNFYANANYRILKPTKTLNSFAVYVNANLQYLFKPYTYTGKGFNINANGNTKKLMSFWSFLAISPGKQLDYFGPREEGRYFISEDFFNFNGGISTNYNKTLAIDANLGYETLFEDTRDYTSYFFGISPRLKLNDKFVMQYAFDYDIEKKERGYVETLDDAIIYGQRDQVTIINSISASYNFNSFHGLNLTFRNYWSTVNYEDELYTLQQNGRLNQNDDYTKADISNPDINYDTWNLDLGYTWQFAPGSQLTALYRNQLFSYTNTSDLSYFKSLDSLFKEPLKQTFSLKLVYYIDYNSVKHLFKSKSKSL